MKIILARTALVFFWGMLAAEIVLAWHLFVSPISPILMPFIVVFVNMALVFIKNILLPSGILPLPQKNS